MTGGLPSVPSPPLDAYSLVWFLSCPYAGTNWGYVVTN